MSARDAEDLSHDEDVAPSGVQDHAVAPAAAPPAATPAAATPAAAAYDSDADSDVEIVLVVSKNNAPQANKPQTTNANSAAAASSSSSAAAAASAAPVAGAAVASVPSSSSSSSAAAAAAAPPSFYAAATGSPVGAFLSADGKYRSPLNYKGALRNQAEKAAADLKKQQAKAAAAAAAAARAAAKIKPVAPRTPAPTKIKPVAASSAAAAASASSYAAAQAAAAAASLYGKPPDPAAFPPAPLMAAPAPAAAASLKRNFTVTGPATTSAPSNKKMKKQERKRIQLLEHQNRLLHEQLAEPGWVDTSYALAPAAAAASAHHGSYASRREAQYASRHEKPLSHVDTAPFDPLVHVTAEELASLQSDWTEVRHVILLDLDNWQGFFKRLPFAFSDDVYLWVFHGKNTTPRVLRSSVPFQHLCEKKHIQFTRCGERPDAADFALVLKLGELNQLCAKDIPFTLFSGDRGFDETLVHIHDRRIQRIDPHNSGSNEETFALLKSIAET